MLEMNKDTKRGTDWNGHSHMVAVLTTLILITSIIAACQIKKQKSCKVQTQTRAVTGRVVHSVLHVVSLRILYVYVPDKAILKNLSHSFVRLIHLYLYIYIPIYFFPHCPTLSHHLRIYLSCRETIYFRIHPCLVRLHVASRCLMTASQKDLQKLCKQKRRLKHCPFDLGRAVIIHKLSGPFR